jgi:hypothetical protein
MRRRLFPIQSLASHMREGRMACAFCARKTSALDNRERERLLIVVRLLRPDVPFDRSRREMSAGSPVGAGKH